MATHSTRYVELTAKVACTGLVIASSGFGAVFAYSVGIQHGYLLAGLTILFAVALELVKPLAIHASLSSLRDWQFLRGLSLGLRGAVAVAYSLTAELGLMSASRGDLVAVRASQAFHARANQDRHQRAQQELVGLKPARPVPELEALVGAPSRCRINVANGYRQTNCTKPPALLAELGRAKRRLELEAILSTAETAIGPTKIADPGSTALATYLGALGIPVSVEAVAQWLNLVPVLALELGSALAMVLVASVTPKAATESAPIPERPALPPPKSERERVAERILSHVRANGQLVTSHRGLAKLTGADRNTVGRAINSLAARGLVAFEATRSGTTLKLLLSPR
jgi:hypothetical protein